MNTKYLLAELEDKIIDTVTSYTSHVPRPFGIVLSGGFDSGFLAALTKPNYAYRMKFPYGTKFDESIYADAVSGHLNLPIKEIEITKENFQGNFVDAVKVMGKPTIHFSLVPLYIMFKTFKKEGVKDVLSGEGIDEYLGGYARYIIFDELRKLYEIPELKNYHGIINEVLDIKFEDKKAGLLEKYVDLLGYVKDGEIMNLTTDLSLQGTIGKMDMRRGQIERMEQRMANHFGINFHYPYINEELAEYCYKLPDNLKIRNGVTKWGFKQIAMRFLPEIMRDRAKMGGPVAPVNRLMGWNLDDFDKSRYLEEQNKILK